MLNRNIAVLLTVTLLLTLGNVIWIFSHSSCKSADGMHIECTSECCEEGNCGDFSQNGLSISSHNGCCEIHPAPEFESSGVGLFLKTASPGVSIEAPKVSENIFTAECTGHDHPVKIHFTQKKFLTNSNLRI